MRVSRIRYWRAAVGGSLLLNAYVLIGDWALQPLHAMGWLQPLLAQANSIAWITSFPGQLVIAFSGIRSALSEPHRTSASAWWIMWAINIMLWAAAQRLILALLLPRTRAAEAGDAEAESATRAAGEPRPSRRLFLTNTARVAAGCAVAAGGYSVMLETRWFEVTRRRHAIRGLPHELSGLRVVQLTDIHHGPALSLGYVREVVAATNALNADLIVLTGDYVHRSPAYIDPVLRELAELRAGIGVVGVLGNHDWWESVTISRRSFTRAGIPLIDNARLFVTPDRTLVASSDRGLCVAGVGDAAEDEIRFDRALGGVPAEMPRLLLSHQPDVAEWKPFVSAAPRVDLMLAGHTHGGQMRLPLLGTPIVPSRYGSKYARGLVQGPICPVYVSRGIGTTMLPLRFGVPPEIALIELVGA